MADIAKEIETLGDYVADLDFARIWYQHLPENYTANEMSIRWAGDGAVDETGYHFRLDRDYQFIYFAQNELAAIQKATQIQRKMNQAKKIKTKDTDGYLSVGSFSFSQPFKAEGSDVYAVIGVLQAQVREAREFAPSPKITGMEYAIRPLFTSDRINSVLNDMNFRLVTNDIPVIYKRAGSAYSGEGDI